jgi:hypothetical protein
MNVNVTKLSVNLLFKCKVTIRPSPFQMKFRGGGLGELVVRKVVI